MNFKNSLITPNAIIIVISCTDMEEKIGVSMRSPLSAHTTWSYAMSKSPTQQQKSQSDPPPNQWNQFR